MRFAALGGWGLWLKKAAPTNWCVRVVPVRAQGADHQHPHFPAPPVRVMYSVCLWGFETIDGACGDCRTVKPLWASAAEYVLAAAAGVCGLAQRRGVCHRATYWRHSS